MKRLLAIVGALFFVSLGVSGRIPHWQVAADEAEDQLKREIAELQSKLTEIQGQKQTLAKTIDYINIKIRLTEKQIQSTEAEINMLEAEVVGLDGKITILDSNLEKLSALLVNRIQTTYTKSSYKPMFLFLTADGFGDFLKRYKYLKTSQKHDREVMYELERAKSDYNQQKEVKELKQDQLEVAKKKLTTQKTSLNQQQQEKQSLLQVTRNDEVKYQELLSKAKAQLEALRRFVTTQGGASILNNQTKCNDWGCYYNQRDAQWGNMRIGNSDSSVAEYGCLITSMAMVSTHYGKSLKPSDIAANSSVFFSDTAYMVQASWTTAGVTMTRTRVCSGCSVDSVKQKIDDELKDNHPVVIGVYRGPDHFIVIKGKEGDEYIMNDPFLENGGDRKFSEKYSLSNISTVDVVRVN